MSAARTVRILANGTLHLPDQSVSTNGRSWHQREQTIRVFVVEWRPSSYVDEFAYATVVLLDEADTQGIVHPPGSLIDVVAQDGDELYLIIDPATFVGREAVPA